MRADAATAQTGMGFAGRCLDVEAAADEEIGGGLVFQSCIGLGEVHSFPTRRSSDLVVLEERAVGDAGDLEVAHLGAVGGIASDDQAGSGLGVLVGGIGREHV